MEAAKRQLKVSLTLFYDTLFIKLPNYKSPDSRNQQMLENSEFLSLFWGHKSLSDNGDDFNPSLLAHQPFTLKSRRKNTLLHKDVV